MSFHVHEGKLLEKYKTIWTKIGRLLNVNIKVYTKFCGLNVPEEGVEFEPFTIISINLLLVYKNKYYIVLNITKYI